MDIGATVCRPRNPDCVACPLRAWCRFAAEVRLGSPATTPAAAATPGALPATATPDAAAPPAATTEPPLARSRAIPFVATTRWLRGRIVDRLRSADGPAWSRVDGPIGDHDLTAVRAALVALARDGVIELDPSDSSRARLALS
jgi:hypothetical protein